MTFRLRAAVTLAGLLALTLAGCGGSSSGKPSDSRTATASSPAAGSTAASTSANRSSSAPGIAAANQLYVSVGDSYAAGWQATGSKRGHTTRNGFAYQVVRDGKAKGYNFTLANFACAGATTTSVLTSKGCKPDLLGPGAPSYGAKTQAAAAEDYLRAHRGKVGLITVALAGNDVTACTDASDTTSCLSAALAKVKTNLATLLKGLRAAAGPSARIVGITYPDVFLGNLLSKDADAKNLANLSVLAFQSFINPALKSSYEAVGGSFVDVTKASGAYGSLSQTTTLPPYGKVPVPVAKICQLTYYCEFQDIHPRTNGYALISKLIVGTLPTR